MDQIYDTIKKRILSSNKYIEYFKLIKKIKLDKKCSQLNLYLDDKSFCILIAGFISQNASISFKSSILERFLLDNRLHSYFDKDNYLNNVISESIQYCQSNLLFGQYLDCMPRRLKPHLAEVHYSVDRPLKVCNLFSPFSISTSDLGDSSCIVHHNSYNYVKAYMYGGSLTTLDLCVLLALIKQLNDDYFSLYKCFLKLSYNDNLQELPTMKLQMSLKKLCCTWFKTSCKQNYDRILNSLKRLSKTYVEIYKNYKKFEDDKDTSQSLELLNKVTNSSYSFHGNLMNFTTFKTVNNAIQLSIELSSPLFLIFEADQYYSLVNWDSVIALQKPNLRFLYFYLCLNTRITNFYQEYTISDLVDHLFKQTVNKDLDTRHKRRTVRNLCIELNLYKKYLYDFNVVLNYSRKRVLESISVKRFRVQYK